MVIRLLSGRQLTWQRAAIKPDYERSPQEYEGAFWNETPGEVAQF